MKTANKLRIVPDGSGLYIYRKGSLAVNRGKHERIGLWDSMDGRNYAACAQCGQINHFDNGVGHQIRFDRQKLYGDVTSCIVCSRCECHFFATLEDWPMELTEDQKKVVRMVRRGLGAYLGIGTFTSDSRYYSAFSLIASAFITSGKGAHVIRQGDMRYTLTFNDTTGTSRNEGFQDWEPAVRKMVKTLKGHAEKRRSL